MGNFRWIIVNLGGCRRSYSTGYVIFVDPEKAINNGDGVIEQPPITNRVTLKALVSVAGHQFKTEKPTTSK